MNLSQIEKKYNRFKEDVIKLKALREEKEEELTRQQTVYQEIQKKIDKLVQVRNLLENSNIASREYIKTEIEQLVTQGLRTIFDDSRVMFNIDFVEKRNQTEAIFYLSLEGEDDHIESEIISSYGGGVVDIISISLRIILMQLLKLEGPLILDEPGKNISIHYIDRFAKFLVEGSKAFDRQIIMVTHNSTLANCADNKLYVDQKGGVSLVRRL